MGDVSERVTIEVEGAGGLEAAAEAARNVAEALRKARDDAAEMSAALGAAGAAGDSLAAAAAAAEADASALGSLRDKALEAAAAVESAAAAGASLGGAAAGAEADAAALGHLRDNALEAAAAQEAAAAAGGGGGLLKALGPLMDPASIASFAGGLGVVAPAIAAIGVEVVGLVSGFAAATAGLGAFAALALPAFKAISTAHARLTADHLAYDRATTAAGRSTALKHLRDDWAALDPAERGALKNLQSFTAGYHKMAKAFEPDAFRVLNHGLKLASTLLPHLKPFADTAANALDGLLKQADKFAGSQGFKDWLKQFHSLEGPALKAIGTGIGNVANAFGKLMTAMSAKDVSHAINIAFGAVSGIINRTTYAVKNLMNMWDDFSAAAKNVGNWGGDIARALGGKAPAQLHNAVASRFAAQPITVPLRPKILGDRHVRVIPQVTPGDMSKAFGVRPVRVPLIPQPRHITAADVAAIFGVKPVKVPLTPQVKPVGAADLKTAGAGAKVPVSADTSKMAGQINNAAKNVKVHGVTVDLSNAKLSGLGALSSSMAQAGQAAGKALDSAIASAIASGAGKALAAAHGITSGVRGSLAGLGGAGQAAGQAMAAGLAAGIRAGQGAAVAAATALANAVAAAAKSAAKISSPSRVWHGIGQQMVAGLVLGLQGGKAAVQAAMTMITGHKPFTDPQIAATVKKLLADVAKAYHSGRLGDPGYPAAIKKDLALTALIRGDNKRLQELAKERQQIENKIKAADALAKSVAQSAAQGGSLGTLAGTLAAGTGGMPGTVTAAGLEQGASAQLAAIKKFQAQLIQLKKEGASKAVIRQIAQAGVQQGGQVATALLAGGKTAVSKMSQLEAQIGHAAKGLGRTAANGAYEAGSQIGKGLAAGLKAELKGITQAMQSLAKQLVKEIRKALKVHSPSLVMAEIGAMIPAGLALGIGQGQGIVVGAMRGLSGEIVGAMKGVQKAAHDITVDPMRGAHHDGHPGRITVGGMIPAHHGHGTGGMIPVHLPGYDHGPGGIVVGRREDPMIRSGHGGGGTTNVHLHTTISVGGMQLAQATQTHQLRHARRNTATGLKLSNRGI